LSGSAASLWQRIAAQGPLRERFLRGIGSSVKLGDLQGASSLGGDFRGLRGRSVLIATEEQLTAALALIELDGIAARMVLCPPGRSTAEIESIARQAEADAILYDTDDQRAALARLGMPVRCTASLVPSPGAAERGHPTTTQPTEWVLLTSGTTGEPKLVVHSLATLAGDLQTSTAAATGTIWSTHYDIRRFGGLQILLRALLCGGSLVLSDPEEPIHDFLQRTARAGVTHMTGTPSHWRRVLMSGSAQLLDPAYVRMSGEIADQPILDHLRATYPRAAIVHAFASTEAGLAFEVTDELAGFPESFVSRTDSQVQLRIEHDSLLIRSPRTSSHYLNGCAEALRREDGFVDTQDLVELRHGRYHFVGRRGGIINVGGQKCHPEEIESVINRHPRVRMSLVRSRKSPLLGSVVVADVVLNGAEAAEPARDAASVTVRNEILAACRESLSAHKVPATIRIVESLDMTPAGKLRRPNA